MINELELKINHNTMVLVLSDMHLGALHTEKSCFNMFLSSVYEMIKDNKLPNLKAMIIIGDIFDLIMDSYTDILKLKDYQNILEKINQLHDIDDFNIVFTLGNHEVPVIGNYDTEFPENKKGMLNNFNREQKKTDIEYSFFKNNDIFSQYILLQSEDLGRSRPIIKLFDTKQDIIRDNSINTIDLNVKANSTEFNNFFLTHGYQFDPNLSFFSKVWYIGLKNPFSFIKQIGDLIWNGVIKKIYEAGRKLFNPDKNDDDEKRETGVDVISKKKVEKMIKTG
ncbi:MAG: metallophosphoesterase, partial [Promethearchaeota archaeon]